MYVKDIFYSIQGEGIYIGKPQIFIRFYGCNIHCAYCDEPDYEKDKINRPLEDVLADVRPYLDKPLHSISITGGEPMLHIPAIKELKQHLDVPFYLETNGTLPDKLPEIIDLFTYFSVDYKPGHEVEFEAFMTQLKGRSGVFVKYVMLKDYPEDDLAFLGRCMSKLPEIPVILQPVTPFADVKEPVNPDDIFRAVDQCAEYGLDVRIIPQTHKYIGIK